MAVTFSHFIYINTTAPIQNKVLSEGRDAFYRDDTLREASKPVKLDAVFGGVVKNPLET